MSLPPQPPERESAAPAEAAPREVELKLALGEGEAGRVLRHPVVRRLGAGRAQTRSLRSLYYDTPELSLQRRGLVLRVRQMGRRYVQTLKTRGDARGGLFDREEVETTVDGSEPDVARIDHAGLRAAVRAETEERGRPLAPVVETDVRRTRRTLVSGTSEIELSLDTGEVRTRVGSLPLREVELELVRGDPAALYDVALALQETLPLRPAHVGKAEQGFAALTGERPRPQKAQPPALARDVTLEAALAAILESASAQILANRDPAHDGHDPEGVHQMRVGVRRMRSALAVFKPVLPTEPLGELVRELRWLAGELGAARDADVFCEETLEPLFWRRAEDRALKRLRDEAAALRSERQAALRRTLESPRAARLELALGRWIAGRCWRDQPLSEEAARLFAPARAFADAVLARRHARALDAGRDLGARSDEERHALRIRLKKLRYAAEFFAPLHPRKKVRRYTRRLSRLQDDLGQLNDVVTAEALLATVLARMGAERGAEHERAAGFVCGWLAARAERRLGKLASHWERFASVAPFWGEGGGEVGAARRGDDAPPGGERDPHA